MIKYENDCVDCDIYCINCGAKHTKHYYCDYCKDEAETLYEYNGKELCAECVLKQLDIVI